VTDPQEFADLIREKFSDPEEGLRVAERKASVLILVVSIIGIGLASVFGGWTFVGITGAIVLLGIFLEVCLKAAAQQIRSILSK